MIVNERLLNMQFFSKVNELFISLVPKKKSMPDEYLNDLQTLPSNDSEQSEKTENNVNKEPKPENNGESNGVEEKDKLVLDIEIALGNLLKDKQIKTRLLMNLENEFSNLNEQHNETKKYFLKPIWNYRKKIKK